MSYLSPAFSPRTQTELEFLEQVNAATGFGLFWPDVVRPLLAATKSKQLLEVGADQGQHTRLLMTYCQQVGGRLTVVEPFVSPALEQIIGTSSAVTLLPQKSHQALEEFAGSVDAVMLEGDLNYATVLRDLTQVQRIAKRSNGAFPLVFFKNSSWPYAHRDMYYDPEDADPKDVHGRERSGMTPWSLGLVAGKLNSPFWNAEREGGARNGVLSAVNDFVANSTESLSIFRIPYNFGLGILYAPGTPAADFIREKLLPPPNLFRLLETFELARINEINRESGASEGPPLPPTRGLRRLLTRLVRGGGRRLLELLEK